MWQPLKKLLANFKSMDLTLGEIVWSRQAIRGHFSMSYVQWRVKQSVNGDEIFVSMAMRPDSSAGPEGSPVNYINFDIERARALRDQLNECIEACEFMMAEMQAKSPQS